VIAEQFNLSRYATWGEFEFLKKYFSDKMKIVDVGCGNGRLIEALEGFEYEYIGMDISLKNTQGVKDRKPDAVVKEGSLPSLPFGDNRFDVTACIATLQHIPSKKLRAESMKDLWRITKPGGYCMMTNWSMAHHRFRYYLIESMLRKLFVGTRLDWWDAWVPWKRKKVNRYYHGFRLREIKRLAEGAGFKVVDNFYAKGSDRVNFWKSNNSVTILRKGD